MSEWLVASHDAVTRSSWGADEMTWSQLCVLSVILALIVLAGCAPLAAPPAKQAEPAIPWKVVLEVEVEHEVVRGGFLNEQFGLTIGRNHHQGLVYRTEDGGKSWHKVIVPSSYLEGLDMVDENLIWTCGWDGHVRVSPDGALTWKAVSSLRHYGRNQFISFLDDQTGWAASTGGSEQLSATRDGGQTWAEIGLPDDIGDLVAIVLRAIDAGYVLDRNGVLYATTDGGKNWSSQPLALEKDPMSLVNAPQGAAMRFFDADRGVIVLSLAGGGQRELVALRTDDGGESWKEEWVTDSIGTLYLTRDGSLLTVASMASNKMTVLGHQGP